MPDDPDDVLRGPPPVPDITADRIAAAMDRAVVIARQAARDPDRVEPQPMLPFDAMRATERWRHYTWWYGRMRGERRRRDPWCWVGWVDEPGALGSWEVWWDPETDRVWLKAEGH